MGDNDDDDITNQYYVTNINMTYIFIYFIVYITYTHARTQMLGSIIKQATQERRDNKSISSQLGTNQIHTLSNVSGFRKVGNNMSFGLYAPKPVAPVAPATKAPVPEPEVPEAAPEAAPEPEAPEPEVPEAPEPEAPEQAPEPEAPAPASAPAPAPASAPAPLPKGMSRAAMRKKQKEEELARQKAQAQAQAPAQAPAPAPIEIASTLGVPPPNGGSSAL